jgi:hypothetical protein
MLPAEVKAKIVIKAKGAFEFRRRNVSFCFLFCLDSRFHASLFHLNLSILRVFVVGSLAFS